MKNKVLLIIISIFALTSCGSNNYKSNEASDYAKEEKSIQGYNEEAGITKDTAIDEGSTDNLVEDPDDYIERFVYLDLETINFDKDQKILRDSIKNLSGLIENESTFLYNEDNSSELRSSDFVIKIPRENVDKFDKALEEVGKTRDISKNSNNLKNSFRDVDKELEIKEKQLEKFNELLENSDNIEDTLVINSKIIEVQGEIDAIKKAKADLKDRVTYDTYNLTLREVYSYDERSNNPNLGERIKEASGESLGIVKEFFAQVIVGIVLYWPFILIILLIIFVLIRVKKKFSKNKNNLKK